MGADSSHRHEASSQPNVGDLNAIGRSPVHPSGFDTVMGILGLAVIAIAAATKLFFPSPASAPAPEISAMPDAKDTSHALQAPIESRSVFSTPNSTQPLPSEKTNFSAKELAGKGFTLTLTYGVDSSSSITPSYDERNMPLRQNFIKVVGYDPQKANPPAPTRQLDKSIDFTPRNGGWYDMLGPSGKFPKPQSMNTRTQQKPHNDLISAGQQVRLPQKLILR